MNLYHECQIVSIYGSQVDILCGGREEVVSGTVQENFEYRIHWSSAFQPFFPCVQLSQTKHVCVSIYLSVNQTVYLFVNQLVYLSVCLSVNLLITSLLSVCTYQSISQFPSVQFLFIFRRSKLVTVNRRIQKLSY